MTKRAARWVLTGTGAAAVLVIAGMVAPRCCGHARAHERTRVWAT